MEDFREQYEELLRTLHSIKQQLDSFEKDLFNFFYDLDPDPLFNEKVNNRKYRFD